MDLDAVLSLGGLDAILTFVELDAIFHLLRILTLEAVAFVYLKGLGPLCYLLFSLFLACVLPSLLVSRVIVELVQVEKERVESS